MADQRPSRRAPDERDFRVLVADLGRLAVRCALYRSDKRQQEAPDSWKIYYAVDADVVGLFLNPHDNPEFGEVFDPALVRRHAPRDRTARLVARALADFLFLKLSPARSGDGPSPRQFVIIPPHTGEFRRLLFNLSSDLDAAGSTAFEQVDALLDQIRIQSTSDVEQDGFVQWMLTHAQQLIELLDRRSGPIEQAARAKALVDRVVSIEHFRDSSGFMFPWSRISGSQDDFERAVRIRSAWHQLMRTHKSRSQRPGAFENDVDVLARLEWINSRLTAERRRLILITGTNAIHEAAAARHDFSGGDGRTSFAELFVRHPQSFLSDESVFDGEAAGGDVQGWQRLLWSGKLLQTSGGDAETLSRRFSESTLSRLHEVASSSRLDGESLSLRGVVKSTLSRWATVVAGTSLVREAESSPWVDRAKRVYEEVIEPLVTDGVDGSKIRELLNRTVVSAWNELYLSSSCLNLWAHAEVDTARARGIPVLRFDQGYEQAFAYCRALIDTLRAPAKRARDEVLDISAVYAALARVDDSHYHGHLVHALAYATKGDWKATRTLCRFALRTVEAIASPRSPSDFRTGREACYLLAVTERRLAESTGELFRAEHYLGLAQEKRAQETRAGALPLGPDIRFDSEAVALLAARVYFAVFASGAAYDHGEWLSATEDILGRVDQLLESAKLATEDENSADVALWVRHQLLISGMSLSLTARFMAGETLASKIPVQARAYDRLFAERKKRDAPERDVVADYVFLCARAVFSQSEAERREAAGQIRKPPPAARPYDRRRFEVFRQLAVRADQ